MFQFLKKGVKFILILFIALVAILYFMQEKIIFLPTTLPQDYTYRFDTNFEEITLTSTNNAQLNAIHFKVNNPKGVILYYHGNAGDLSRWGAIAEYFTQFDYDVVVMDYRTYGKSTGELSEKALYKDAMLFYNYAKKKYTEESILVYGRSLGATFATYVASKNKPNRLILETPFYNLKDVAKARFPFLPVSLLLQYHFPSNEFITQVSSPITIYHGTEDKIVPYNSGKKLYKQASLSQQKELVTVKGGKHNNLITFDSYKKHLASILQ